MTDTNYNSLLEQIIREVKFSQNSKSDINFTKQTVELFDSHLSDQKIE